MNDLFASFYMITASALITSPPPTPPPARSGEIVSLAHGPARLCKCRSCFVASVYRQPPRCWHFTWPEWKRLCACSTRRTLITLSCVRARLCARVNISTSSSLHGAQRLKITSQMFEVQHCATLCCPSGWFIYFFFPFLHLRDLEHNHHRPFVVLRRLRAILYLVCSGTLLSAVLLCCCFNRGFSNKKQIPPCFFFFLASTVHLNSNSNFRINSFRWETQWGNSSICPPEMQLFTCTRPLLRFDFFFFFSRVWVEEGVSV